MRRRPSTGRSLLAYPAIVAGTAFVSPLITAAGLLTRRHGPVPDALARGWAVEVLRAAGVEVRTSGLHTFPHDRHFVFAGNHRSHLDPPTLLATVPQLLRFVAKRSLFFVPLFGPALWAAGNIPVDRSASGRDRARLEAATREVGRVTSLLFFPEGTRRTEPGLGAFKKGAAAMALQARVSIVPFALAGSGDRLPPGLHRFSPGPSGLAFGAPIELDPFGPEDRAGLTEALRARVEALLPEAEALLDR